MIKLSEEIRLKEVCDTLQLNEDICIELVEFGLISPPGDLPEEWKFDLQMVGLLRQAVRLRNDLHLEWSVTAIVINLLEEREKLRSENSSLQSQLNRFLDRDLLE